MIPNDKKDNAPLKEYSVVEKKKVTPSPPHALMSEDITMNEPQSSNIEKENAPPSRAERALQRDEQRQNQAAAPKRGGGGNRKKKIAATENITETGEETKEDEEEFWYHKYCREKRRRNEAIIASLGTKQLLREIKDMQHNNTSGKRGQKVRHYESLH